MRLKNIPDHILALNPELSGGEDRSGNVAKKRPKSYTAFDLSKGVSISKIQAMSLLCPACSDPVGHAVTRFISGKNWVSLYCSGCCWSLSCRVKKGRS